MYLKLQSSSDLLNTGVVDPISYSLEQPVFRLYEIIRSNGTVL